MNQVKRALSSVRRFNEMIDELTEEEVHAALVFECETQRRSSIVERLLAKAADFNRQTYLNSLKEKIKWHALPPL